MATVTIHEAKTHLSRLIERARQGEEIVIAKGREPVVKLTPVAPKGLRRPGVWKGLVSSTEDAFAPLTDAELEEWGLEFLDGGGRGHECVVLLGGGWP